MRILFVCSANTCRSPMAEALLKEQVKYQNIEVRSAGVSALNGDPTLSYAQSILEERGINYSHQSQRINPELMEWANLVLTMTKTQKYILLAMFPEIGKQIFTLKEFVGEKENPDINNPKGSDLSSYRQCAEEIMRSLDRLLEKLQHIAL